MRRTLSLLTITVFLSLCPAAAQQHNNGAPDDVRGNWVIYSKDVNNDKIVKKYITLHQNGNHLSGHFRGPNQEGGIDGWINVHHIVFSTKTKNVLTFRGQVNGNTMSGMYGIHGRHAEWTAERTE
jgi:hypothetical protein